MQYISRLICLLGISFATMSAMPLNAQSNIDFTSDIQAACAPALITFTNQSVPISGSTFIWYFGNGKTSTAINPQITFTEPGAFSVKLVMSNNQVKDSVIKEAYVKIMDKPTAMFSLKSDTLGCAPMQAEFENNSVDSQGALLQYIWSFGDGSKSTATNPIVTYSTAGDFDVTLMVTNQYGCSSSYTQSKLVHALKPVPMFGASATSSCNGELNVVFNNLTVSPIDYTTEWLFGTGDKSNEKSPTYHYAQPGTFTVGLTVTDTFGCVSKTESVNLIRIVKTEAQFLVSEDTICPGETISFTNKSKNANRFKWSFGDGTAAVGFDAINKFNDAGDFPVQLIASNGTCADTASFVVNVEYVKANFTVDHPVICQLPQTVNYINQSVNAVKLDWHLGIGTNTSIDAPSVEYSNTVMKAGQYDAFFNDTLIVTSKHGCLSKMIKPSNVSVYLPKVLADPGAGGNKSLLSGCVPMDLKFHDKSIYNNPNDSIIKRAWTLAGNASVEANDFSAQINVAGRLSLLLTVTTAKGCVHTAEEIINAGNKVAPDFELIGSPNRCAVDPIDFKITSPASHQISSVFWDFGDGDKGAFPYPPHFYTKTGPMDVTLNVFNFGCRSTVVKRGVVNILGPLASIKPTVNCEKPHEILLEGTMMDGTSFQWDFGDGSPLETGTLQPVHHYPEKGDYVVTLNTSNSLTGCAYNLTQQVRVRELKSVISPIPDKVCLNSQILLDGSTSVDAVAFPRLDKSGVYLWLINDGEEELFTDDKQFKTLLKKEPVKLSLITNDANGCADTANIHVKVFQPAVAFEGNYLKGCMPVTFEFKDLSVSDTTITKWEWSFGDNATSGEQNPSHDYLSFGKYSVGLTVTDAVGCSKSMLKGQHVSAIFPNADFSVTDSMLCIGESTRFFDKSTSQVIDYKWTIGEVATSDLVTPTIVFPDTGRFAVTLEITDNHGCKTSSTRNSFISVQSPPNASFSSDVSSSNCYPFLVQFTDESVSPYLSGWKWTFGENQNVSTLQNPFFMYNKPGNHTVSLIAFTSNGCSDTIVKKDMIKVMGPYAKIGIKDTLCQDMPTPFVALEKMNIYDLRWDFGDGFTAAGDSVWHTYTNPGDVIPLLFIRSDDKNTCDKVFVDTTNVLDLRAKFEFGEGVPKGCVPLSVSFVNKSLNSDSWQWDLGNGDLSELKNPTTTYPIAGNYNVSLIAKHHLGCRDTFHSASITAFPLPTIIATVDTLICVGDIAQLFAQGALSYQWSPENLVDTPSAPMTHAKPSQTTLFTVTGTDANGCINQSSTLVMVQQIPTLALHDTTIIVGENIRMDISDGALNSYAWSPATGLSCYNCPDPLVMPLLTTQYFITVTDTSNCFIRTYPLNINVLQQFSIDVPDAFSPNGDLINDVAFVKGWGIKELLSFKIFNRFGQLVYQSQDIQEGWDGTFKGQPQPIERYQYVVEVRTYSDEVLTKRGSLIIVR